MAVRPSENSLRMSDSVANFFKVILPSTIENQRLDIPLKSAIEFGEELSNVATLTVPAGGVWQVGLERAHKRIWFVHNWQKFAEHYSLTAGQFLVFSYQGNSRFHVRIFDFSCCEIEYPCVGQSIKQEEDVDDDVCVTLPSSHKGKARCVDQHVKRKRKNIATQLEEDIEDDVCVALPSSSKGKGKCVDQHVNKKRKSVAIAKKFKQAKLKVQRISPCQDIPTMNKHKELYVENMAAYTYPCHKITIAKERKKLIHAIKMFKLENPFFAVILQQRNLDENYMHVPSAYTMRYMRGCPECIKFEDSNEIQWVVRRHFRTTTTLRIGRGCTQFFKDNNLKNGDVCLYELIKRKDVVLKFSVLRAAEYAAMVLGKKINPEILHSRNLYFSRNIRAIMSRMSKQTKRAMEAVRALKITNPAFVITFREFNIYNYVVQVPAQFVKNHMRGCAEWINLMTSGDKQWPVRCSHDPERRSTKLCAGFGPFTEDNNLKDGDVCVFELIKSEAVEFKVSIFRASDYESV